MAMYESEHTKFMREWLKQHPEQIKEQERGRALWWDKPQDLETLHRNAVSQVPQTPYYYDSDS